MLCVDFYGSPFTFSNNSTVFHETSYELYATEENTGSDAVTLIIRNNIIADGPMFETGPAVELLALYPKIMYSKTGQQNVQFSLTNN
jgi:hypothetical protein